MIIGKKGESDRRTDFQDAQQVRLWWRYAPCQTLPSFLQAALLVSRGLLLLPRNSLELFK